MRSAEIANLLPDVYQRTLRPGGPLAALLDAMETLLAPADDAIDRFPEYLDPRTTPDNFVPLLTRWVDLDHLFLRRLRGRDVSLEQVMPSGFGRLRELIAAAGELSRWRGTAQALTWFLEIATGQAGFEVEEDTLDARGRPRPFHVRVCGPAEAEPFRAMIEEIIEAEKPAHVTHEFVTRTGDEDHVNHC